MTTAASPPTPQMVFTALHRAIGSTPMAVIDCRFRGVRRRIFAKLEMGNLTGSVKDRMALHILWSAYDDGSLRPGMTIAEATSGNTGIAMSGIGRALGHPVTIFMPDWMSRERVDIIRAYGATIVPVSRAEGGFLGSIRLSEEFAASRPDVFLPRQFANPANIEAHERCTGPEILLQLRAVGLTPDAFVAGVGTGGTVMGVGRCLRAASRAVRVHPLEPTESPTLSTGHQVGQHRIQGISDEFIPAIVDLASLDEVIDVSDGDAILMAQALARIGLAVGISSGANLLGALLAQERLGPEAVVVTVLSDCNRKYLTTDLFRDEPVKPGYLTPHVELGRLDLLGRPCRFCGQLDTCEHWDSRS